MAEGVLALAAIWQAAWIEGNGDAIADLSAADKRDLKKLYRNPAFIKSVPLASLTLAKLEPQPIDDLVTL